MLTDPEVARVCHEANRAYCLSHGDTSHKPWEETPKEIQDSVISGVRAKRDNPAITPKESHEAWLAYKGREGWVYGEEKNFALLTHPCFRPYEELPLEDRRKDTLFLAIVRALSEE
jgi:hypothetical protein